MVKKKRGSKKPLNTDKKTKKGYIITIIEGRCKGCGLCVKYCPTGTLEMSDEINPKGIYVPVVMDIDSCKGCELCFKFCPDFAIFCSENTPNINRNKKNKEK